jgi:Domain of unknown function (DUF4232)
MAGRRAAAGLVFTALGLTVAGCGLGSTKTVTVSHGQTVTTTVTVTTTSSRTSATPCTGQQLSGTFVLVPGSAGAGQIEYGLTLTNTSHSACYVRGIPKATLLGASAAALPTHVTAGGDGAPARVVLEPGASAVAHARFSPDVPGQGDSQSGACQPQAHTLQVMPNGGGVTDAAIRPATSVCEQGTLNFETLGYAG